MSSISTSRNPPFGLPLFFLPGSFILNMFCPAYPSSAQFHITSTSPVLFTACAVPQICSLLILPILIPPSENLSIFSSASLSDSAAVSKSDIIAGLTTLLHPCLSLFLLFLAQISPDISTHSTLLVLSRVLQNVMFRVYNQVSPCWLPVFVEMSSQSWWCSSSGSGRSTIA